MDAIWLPAAAVIAVATRAMLPGLEDAVRARSGRAALEDLVRPLARFTAVSADRSSQRIRCLIVDDDDYVRETVRDMLKKHGYETDVAADGAEALEKFRVGSFDLVVTDLRMPKLDGVQFTRQGKELNRSVPFLLLTGFSGTVTDEELADSGIDRVISKPVRMTELLGAVTSLAG